jgi:hypothetical protein
VSASDERLIERLQQRCVELERSVDWYLERVHQLEAFIAAGGTRAPQPLPGDLPRLVAEGDDDHSRYVARIELFEAELAAAEREAAEKEAVIAELAAASEERLATIVRIDAEAAALRAELEALRARLDDEPAG